MQANFMVWCFSLDKSYELKIILLIVFVNLIIRKDS